MDARDLGLLLERLRGGWTPSNPAAIHELVGIWQKHVGGNAVIEQTGVNGVYFICSLANIRLSGTDDVRVIVLSGQGEALLSTLHAYWTSTFAVGRLICVLALSDEAYAAACERCASAGCVLRPAQVYEILTSAEPRQVLKRCLREQIPLRTLIPFNINLSAADNMFFGRERELRRLVEDEASCFAVAGPSRIGKTTLVKAYRRYLKRERPLRTRSTFYIDLYACPDSSDRGILRFIARHIASSRYAERVNETDFVSFLKYQVHQLGQPLDLILDEADEICQRHVLDQVLRAATGQKLCRFIFCGRGELFRIMNGSHSPFNGRVTLLHLPPLPKEDAQSLIVEPFTDLGLRLDPHVVQQLLVLTGRLPHLLQLYGRRLAELAIEERSSEIGLAHLETLQWDFALSRYFTSMLQEPTSAEAKLVALLLIKSRRESFTSVAVQETVKPELELSYSRTCQICDELVMENILTWELGSYHIASGALALYAEKLDFLDAALQDARKAVKAARTTAGAGKERV